MDEIKDIVKNVVSSIEQQKDQKNKNIYDVWKGCVKEKEALHTKVQGIKGNVLYVNVDCSAWMFQCRLRYKIILKEVQREYPEVKRIYFKVGKIK